MKLMRDYEKINKKKASILLKKFWLKYYFYP